MIEVDQNYHLVLKQLEETINGSRQKVIRVANTELLTTYWEIGRTILERKEIAGGGKKGIEKLANQLKAKFPNMKGLSERNLGYMQTFASSWPFFPFTQPVVAELHKSDSQQINIQQPLLTQIPWTYHMLILDKVNTLAERIFYIKEAIRNGWSRNTLKVNIETRLHECKGNAIGSRNCEF
jgi:predicted nuclease of restriction endonuclease-like (RecB) superfamily